MKKAKIISLVALLGTITNIFSISSCTKNNFNIECDENVQIISYSTNDNFVAKINVNKNFALDEEKSYFLIEDNNSSFKIFFNTGNFLQFSVNVPNNIIIIPTQGKRISALSLKTISLEKWGNRYTEKYQSNFWKNLTVSDHDYTTTNNLYCSSQAEGIYMYTYGPGYTVWNTYLHDGKETQMVDTDVNVESFKFPDASDPRNLDKMVERANLPLKLSDYKQVDDGLNLSKAMLKLTVYHGLETNESELINFLNQKLNFDIKMGDPEKARKINLEVLNGASYTNLGWCATSLDKNFAMDWAQRWSAEFKNSPVLEITLDPNVCCAYVSYTNKKYFNTYLAWPHEYQILTQRNLKFTFTTGEWIKKDNGDNILYLKCNASISE